METIVFTQSKGGQAKTTSCYELAYCLSQDGYRVLCVDLDSQGNLSRIAQADRDSKGIFEVLIKGEDINKVVQDFRYGKIITADDNMNSFDYLLKHTDNDLFLLYDALQNLKDKPDYVLLDCPPNLMMATRNALVAADRVIIPSAQEEMGMEGIATLARTLKLIRKVNEVIEIDGILITLCEDHIRINREMEHGIRILADGLEVKVYNTKIRRNAALKNAHKEKRAVQEAFKRSNSARDYQTWYQELKENWNND